METCQQSQNQVGSKFNCLNYILLYVERQTPFNPDEMEIEQKLFALAISTNYGNTFANYCNTFAYFCVMHITFGAALNDLRSYRVTRQLSG